MRFLALLSVLSLGAAGTAAAQEHHRRGEEHRFEAHHPGTRPGYQPVRRDRVRVLAPRVIVRNHPAWRHWDHEVIVRPTYYWNWRAVRNVSCTAEDSYGDQYPVTLRWRGGWGADNMGYVENQALDRCYQESGGDQSCYLVGCSHF